MVWRDFIYYIVEAKSVALKKQKANGTLGE